MSAETPKKSLTFAIMGDCFVGKTSLVQAFLKGESSADVSARTSGEYGIQQYKCRKNFKGREYELILLDVAGQAHFDDQIDLNKAHIDCIILCYSLIRRTTYDSIRTKWLPWIRQDYSEVPVVLVGIQLKGKDDRKKCVSTPEARRLCKEVKFSKLVECWIEENINVQRVFKKSVRAFKKMSKKNKKHQCKIA